MHTILSSMTSTGMLLRPPSAEEHSTLHRAVVLSRLETTSCKATPASDLCFASLSVWEARCADREAVEAVSEGLPQPFTKTRTLKSAS